MFHVLVGKQVLADQPGGRVGQLVHQQMVANQQCVFHRSRRYHERLYESCCAEQQQQDRDGPLGNGAAPRIVLRCCRLVGFRCLYRSCLLGNSSLLFSCGGRAFGIWFTAADQGNPGPFVTCGSSAFVKRSGSLHQTCAYQSLWLSWASIGQSERRTTSK